MGVGRAGYRGSAAVAAVAAVLGMASAASACPPPERVPAECAAQPDGTGGDWSIGIWSAISLDGRVVAYGNSVAPGPRFPRPHVFVRDLRSGVLCRADVGSDGEPGATGSTEAALNGDGRYVAFNTVDPLVPGDTNGTFDVYLRDRLLRTTRRISLSSNGAQANGYSSSASLSGTGRYIAFSSAASNLVPGDTNGDYDVFVRDVWRGWTERVSLDGLDQQRSGWSAAPSISADGRLVAFAAEASAALPGQLPDIGVYVRDRLEHTTRRLDVPRHPGTRTFAPTISADSRFVAFQSNAPNLVPGDTNRFTDVFVADVRDGTIRRANISSHGEQANREGSAGRVTLSADGRFIAFDSAATNLAPGDTNAAPDVFVHDMRDGSTELVSLTDQGKPADSGSGGPAISGDGQLITFSSDATNLVPGPSCNVALYLADRPNRTLRRINNPC